MQGERERQTDRCSVCVGWMARGKRRDELTLSSARVLRNT